MLLLQTKQKSPERICPGKRAIPCKNANFTCKMNAFYL